MRLPLWGLLSSVLCSGACISWGVLFRRFQVGYVHLLVRLLALFRLVRWRWLWRSVLLTRMVSLRRLDLLVWRLVRSEWRLLVVYGFTLYLRVWVRADRFRRCTRS